MFQNGIALSEGPTVAKCDLSQTLNLKKRKPRELTLLLSDAEIPPYAIQQVRLISYLLPYFLFK